MGSQAATLRRLVRQAFQYHQDGRLQEAAKIYFQVLRQDPDNADGNHLLGVIALQSGKNDKAVQLISRAIANNPRQPAFYNNLGNAYKALGLYDKSVAAFQSALRFEPDYVDALCNLGNVLQQQGRQAEAVQNYQKVLDREPDSVDVLNNLAATLQEMGRLTEAAHYLHRALAIKPDFADAHNNLGGVLKDQGRLEESLQSFQKGLAVQPDFVKAHSNLLCTLNYFSNFSQDDIFKQSRQWNRQHGAVMRQKGQPYENIADMGRRLRIGYVSPDLRTHSVANFFEPVLRAHHGEEVETFCYANVKQPDNVTARLRETANYWRSIVGLSDEDVAGQIEKDRIDILVDLAGHTRANRLPVFAHKPAPIQVTWLGYPNTTGLAVMDYRLTDAVADPIGEADRLHSEQLIRLEHGFLCFQADSKAPAVSAAPFLETGHITFGSFNNLTKAGPAVVRAWAGILEAVEDSRLLLKAKQLSDHDTGNRFLELFERAGIAADRIVLQGWCAEQKDHYGLYSRVDIGLDPFPYNGTTTTCEALWMGVPVVTLRGSRHAGRVGASILHRVGLPELIAENVEEYIKLAHTLASDHQRLAAMRQTLRGRMSRSPLMDTEGFVASLEHAYRQMWVNWCGKRD